MAQRLELQTLLESVLGSKNVYFQPPSNIGMNFPCIIYKRDDFNINYANNKFYVGKKRYQITVVDKNPDSLISDAVATLPLCSYDRFYVADNLNHDVFNMFF
jgi:hypothetical protein